MFYRLGLPPFAKGGTFKYDNKLTNKVIRTSQWASVFFLHFFEIIQILASEPDRIKLFDT